MLHHLGRRCHSQQLILTFLGLHGQAYWEISKKLLIAPYVPGSMDPTRFLLGFEQPILPLEERQTLLFMRATCLPFMYMYPNNTRITTGKVRDALCFPSCCRHAGTGHG